MECPICKSSAAVRTLDKKVMGSDSAKVLYCEYCDFAFLKDVNLGKDFYEKDFDAFMASRSCDVTRENMEKNFVRCLSQDATERIKLINKYADLSKCSSILEMGSSTGFMIEALKKACPSARVEGVEPGKAAREFSTEKGHKVYSSIDEISGKYDCIMSFFVLEHIPDPISWVETLYSKINKGGKLITVLPNLNEALVKEYQDKNYDGFVWQAPHVSYFSSRALEVLMRKFSSKVSVADYQRYTLSNHLNWLSGLKPKKSLDYTFITDELNNLYKKCLENGGRADTLISVMQLD